LKAPFAEKERKRTLQEERFVSGRSFLNGLGEGGTPYFMMSHTEGEKNRRKKFAHQGEKKKDNGEGEKREKDMHDAPIGGQDLSQRGYFPSRKSGIVPEKGKTAGNAQGKKKSAACDLSGATHEKRARRWRKSLKIVYPKQVGRRCLWHQEMLRGEKKKKFPYKGKKKRREKWNRPKEKFVHDSHCGGKKRDYQGKRGGGPVFRKKGGRGSSSTSLKGDALLAKQPIPIN